MLADRASITDTSRQPLGVVCPNVPIIRERKMRLLRYSLNCLPCWLYHIFEAKEGWPSFISLSVIKHPNHIFFGEKILVYFFLLLLLLLVLSSQFQGILYHCEEGKAGS